MSDETNDRLFIRFSGALFDAGGTWWESADPKRQIELEHEPHALQAELGTVQQVPADSPVSGLVDTINRLEAWVQDYGHEKQSAFIADLQALIGAAKVINRAMKVLRGLEDFGGTDDDGLVSAHVVDHALAIMQEGQQLHPISNRTS